MARDIYKSRKMYESPIYLLLLIPLGVILIFFLCDFGYTQYFKYKLKNDVTEVFTMAMDRTSLHNETAMQNYIIDKLVERGYIKDELKASIIYRDDDTILILYSEYYSIVDSLIFRKTKMTSVKLIGHYNEYKETIIEDFDEEIDESELDKLGETYDPDTEENDD